jgi:hypothetical protein
MHFQLPWRAADAERRHGAVSSPPWSSPPWSSPSITASTALLPGPSSGAGPGESPEPSRVELLPPPRWLHDPLSPPHPHLHRRRLCHTSQGKTHRWIWRGEREYTGKGALPLPSLFPYLDWGTVGDVTVVFPPALFACGVRSYLSWKPPWGCLVYHHTSRHSSDSLQENDRSVVGEYVLRLSHFLIAKIPPNVWCQKIFCGAATV